MKKIVTFFCLIAVVFAPAWASGKHTNIESLEDYQRLNLQDILPPPIDPNLPYVLPLSVDDFAEKRAYVKAFLRGNKNALCIIDISGSNLPYYKDDEYVNTESLTLLEKHLRSFPETVLRLNLEGEGRYIREGRICLSSSAFPQNLQNLIINDPNACVKEISDSFLSSGVIGIERYQNSLRKIVLLLPGVEKIGRNFLYSTNTLSHLYLDGQVYTIGKDFILNSNGYVLQIPEHNYENMTTAILCSGSAFKGILKKVGAFIPETDMWRLFFEQ